MYDSALGLDFIYKLNVIFGMSLILLDAFKFCERNLLSMSAWIVRIVENMLRFLGENLSWQTGVRNLCPFLDKRIELY